MMILNEAWTEFYQKIFAVVLNLSQSLVLPYFQGKSQSLRSFSPQIRDSVNFHFISFFYYIFIEV